MNKQLVSTIKYNKDIHHISSVNLVFNFFEGILFNLIINKNLVYFSRNNKIHYTTKVIIIVYEKI